jgi:hypothetical protein
MSTQADDSNLPQNLSEAISERDSLRHQIQLSVHEMSIRREGVRERLVPTVKLWENTRPHDADKEAEFLKLHSAFLKLMKDFGESQRASTASIKEVPPSSTTLKFLKNRSSPPKALQHEQKVIGVLRSELSNGIPERSRIFDHIDELADEMEKMVEAETDN